MLQGLKCVTRLSIHLHINLKNRVKTFKQHYITESNE